MALDKVKRHLRIPHEIEDETITDYINWAESDIIEAVYDSYDSRLNKETLELDPTYQKALVMMASYYYENRLAISEVSIQEAPFSVTHAIQLLRANRDRHLKSEV